MRVSIQFASETGPVSTMLCWPSTTGQWRKLKFSFTEPSLCLIKDLARVLFKKSKYKVQKHPCRRCLRVFFSEALLREHIRDCMGVSVANCGIQYWAAKIIDSAFARGANLRCGLLTLSSYSEGNRCLVEGIFVGSIFHKIVNFRTEKEKIR